MKKVCFFTLAVLFAGIILFCENKEEVAAIDGSHQYKTGAMANEPAKGDSDSNYNMAILFADKDQLVDEANLERFDESSVPGHSDNDMETVIDKKPYNKWNSKKLQKIYGELESHPSADWEDDIVEPEADDEGLKLDDSSEHGGKAPAKPSQPAINRDSEEYDNFVDDTDDYKDSE